MLKPAEHYSALDACCGLLGPVRASCFVFCIFRICYFCLSVLVQSIAWKDSSLKWPVMCRVGH